MYISGEASTLVKVAGTLVTIHNYEARGHVAGIDIKVLLSADGSALSQWSSPVDAKKGTVQVLL